MDGRMYGDRRMDENNNKLIERWKYGYSNAALTDKRTGVLSDDDWKMHG